MLVAQDDVEHEEVPANSNNEDTGVQAEEDHLHPVLVKVELLVVAHLLNFMILFYFISTSDSYFLVVATISEQYSRTICKMQLYYKQLAD